MKICFLVWSPDISGGTNVILEHATRLKDYGNDVTIVTESAVTESDVDWFKGANLLKWKTYDDVENEVFDLAFATWWRTVFYLKRVKSSRYAYFVQSIESKFYSEDEVVLRNLIEQTYSLELDIVTEATWIAEYLSSRYHQDVHLVKNGIRKEFFNTEIVPTEARIDGKVRVLVEGPLNVSFKNTELAVALANESDADEVWLLTSTPIGSYEGVDRLFSRVPISKVGEIYSSCDVIVKLSTVEGMFGPPLECFHCGGTSVSYDVTGYDEYIENEVNGLVSFSRDNSDIVSKINRLVSEPELLASLKEKAIETANKWPTWEESSLQFEEACKRIISESELKQNIDSIGVKADLMFSTYEAHISTPRGQVINLGIKGAVVQRLRLRSPKLFSVLTKIRNRIKSN
ncbi:glycosyltransferase involved in cell wall biosynthesis [Vibrio diazotrophicus]|uniref:Glycosyltransferase involved in cell wall biosynthesis n=1 Tax=Vibrio diazotrophicus TaxID=685 RepID=A0A329DY58_VIBDI|nr:glycosyltransferase family 4 protein [Vibrio diazotrophicus]RAS54433.1 glycosyltransferase involved in cell wall biosynthesis [Vibrio diazotrophicus]